MLLVGFIFALVSSQLAAVAAFPMLKWHSRTRAWTLVLLAIPIALSPLWIPAPAAFIRLLATLNATALLVKLYDIHVSAKLGRRPSWREFLCFLPNFFSVVWRRLGQEPRYPRHENFARFGIALGKTAIAGAVLIWLFRRDWGQVPWFVEHAFKVVVFFLFLIPGSSALVAVWRLAGGRAREFMDAPLLAWTPAEFWRRYNRPAQQFFYEDVFKRAGGLRSPGRAILTTFVVSAVVHEYFFGIILGRIQGYQTVFFLLQGAGVAATWRSRPGRTPYWAWVTATWIFNLATSVLFFASVNEVVPFYAQPLPPWLANWGTAK